MSKKSRISFDIKLKYVQEYLEGKIRIYDICEEINITRWTFHWWITKYNLNGAEGLRQTSQNTKYPKEIKNFAVEDYLLGKSQYSKDKLIYEVNLMYNINILLIKVYKDS